ncbi:AAA family ATPase [Corynebacterium lowii]|uniref:Vitamin B12 import ATP-binding protein BtuD n=1 Tax=Corynebacterium lowii TaxID=1544413 RepID=A0A0Q1E1J8_9CORY|nr:AAA family ATPase [Corynebacterium lowii]KQB86342.1 Vitamin B12 import ATP-binding protein BtuD [Corynebacterium lowii]MDP9850827.1 putative ATPase [Corynebacterium lowii]
MFLQSLSLNTPLHHLSEDYVAALPAVQHVAQHPLRFTAPVTIFSGENGAGKSTLIEAIAVGMGFQHQGGTRHLRTDRPNDVSELYKYLTLSRSQNPPHGYFLRGETHFNVAIAYGEIDPGSPHLNHMSHGESLMQVMRQYFHGGGFFILDEPEAGLSLLRQLELLGLIANLARQGSQFLLATHSPILMAIPQATLLEITDAGISSVAFEKAEAVQAAHEFILNPEETARYLLGENNE